MSRVDLDDKHREIVCKILKGFFPQLKIYVFGSRIDGRAKKYSDLDLALDTGSKISFLQLSQVEEALALTEIPFKVDITDIHSVSTDFKKHILGHHIVW